MISSSFAGIAHASYKGAVTEHLSHVLPYRLHAVLILFESQKIYDSKRCQQQKCYQVALMLSKC